MMYYRVNRLLSHVRDLIHGWVAAYTFGHEGEVTKRKNRRSSGTEIIPRHRIIYYIAGGPVIESCAPRRYVRV